MTMAALSATGLTFAPLRRRRLLEGLTGAAFTLPALILLVLTILLGPLGMLAHLVVRAVRQRSGVSAAS